MPRSISFDDLLPPPRHRIPGGHVGLLQRHVDVHARIQMKSFYHVRYQASTAKHPSDKMTADLARRKRMPTGKYCYDYPRPAVTVDVVIVTREDKPRVLLVRRKHEPFAGRWAIPGGFVDEDEPLEDAAQRELFE